MKNDVFMLKMTIFDKKLDFSYKNESFHMLEHHSEHPSEKLVL